MDVDIVINVQGDEPFIDSESLKKIIQVFKNDTDKKIDLASLMTPITDWDEISNPNTVKVIVDNQDFALWPLFFLWPPRATSATFENPLMPVF